jgi:hypothetical protein
MNKAKTNPSFFEYVYDVIQKSIVRVFCISSLAVKIEYSAICWVFGGSLISRQTTGVPVARKLSWHHDSSCELIVLIVCKQHQNNILSYFALFLSSTQDPVEGSERAGDPAVLTARCAQYSNGQQCRVRTHFLFQHCESGRRKDFGGSRWWFGKNVFVCGRGLRHLTKLFAPSLYLPCNWILVLGASVWSGMAPPV